MMYYYYYALNRYGMHGMGTAEDNSCLLLAKQSRVTGRIRADPGARTLGRSRGGRPVRIPDPNPPPPSRPPPKVFEPVFLQFEIFGEWVGAEGAENLFFPS